MTTWTAGEVRVTKLPQMTWHLPLWGLVPEATGEAAADVAPGVLPGDGMTEVSIHGLLVESQGRTILVDTCADHGEAAERALDLVRSVGSITEHHPDVRTALEAAGRSPAEVDTVLCTHLHFDHVGGNLLDDGSLAFPGARHLLAGEEWAYWTTDDAEDPYGSIDTTVRPLVEAGAVDLVDGDHVLTDEVRLVPTPGHTPGHVSVRIDSAGETAIITGDVAHHPVELLAPHWTMAADTDAAQASVTRRAFAEEWGDGQALILGTHFPGSSAGRLSLRDKAWVPA